MATVHSCSRAVGFLTSPNCEMAEQPLSRPPRGDILNPASGGIMNGNKGDLKSKESGFGGFFLACCRASILAFIGIF